MDPSPAPPPPPPPPRLVRDPDDKVVAGVCAAFGRYTDTDPVLWRVAIAVLALFGGAGLALYGLGWLLLPRTGEPQSLAERTLRRPDRSLAVGGVVLAVVAGVVLLGVLGDGSGAAVLLVLGGIGYLVARERRDPRPAGSPHVPPVGPAYGPPRPPRERSALGGITLSTAAVLAGLLLALRAAGAEELTASRILASVLLVVGAGLLVGTWVGRARWLLPIGLLLAVALAGAATTERLDLDDGVGERSWRAADGGDYALGAGEATLDLRGLRGVSDAQVQARIGLGELTVLVPDGMSVRVLGEVGLGDLRAPGLDVEESDHIEEDFVVGSADDVTVTIDLEVGVGEIEVRRVAA